VAVHHVAHDAEEHVVRACAIAAEREPGHLLIAVADNRAFHALEELSASLGHS
jgi:hypothetical protein